MDCSFPQNGRCQIGHSVSGQWPSRMSHSQPLDYRWLLMIREDREQNLHNTNNSMELKPLTESSRSRRDHVIFHSSRPSLYMRIWRPCSEDTHCLELDRLECYTIFVPSYPRGFSRSLF